MLWKRDDEETGNRNEKIADTLLQIAGEDVPNEDEPVE